MAESKYLDEAGLQRTWSRIKSWLSSNYATISALNSGLSGKANSSHTHTYSSITNLSTWKSNNFGSGSYSISSGYEITVNSSGVAIGSTSATNVNKDIYVTGKATVQGYVSVDSNGRVDINEDCQLTVATPTSNSGESFFGDAGLKMTRCSGSYYIYNSSSYSLKFIILYGSSIKTVTVGVGARQNNVVTNYTGPLLIAWTKA